MLAFRLARSGDFLHFIFVVCILHLLQHLNAFTLCLLQIKILWWISIFSKYHLKCHPEGKTCRDQTPPSPQLWMSVNQNWACIVQKSFLKRSIEKLKLFSRSCDVLENWKHSRVYLGLVPDGCNSLQFPPLFNTVSPPTFTAHVPFWPPSSPPTVFCESFIFSGDQPRLLSKLMPTCKNTEALLNAFLTQRWLSEKLIFPYNTIFGDQKNTTQRPTRSPLHLDFILKIEKRKTGNWESSGLVTCLIFHQRLRGSTALPAPHSVHALMGHGPQKQKRVWPPRSPPPTPASAYITVWTPVQVLSVCV